MCSSFVMEIKFNDEKIKIETHIRTVLRFIYSFLRNIVD